MSMALVVIAACGGDSGGSSGGDAATDDGGAPSDAPPASDGAVAPGWRAPFALDPAAIGLTESATWDFTETQISGADPVLVSGMFENASNPSAPVSGPGVGRSLFTGETSDGAQWRVAAAQGGQKRRVYVRSMFALSSPYAVSTGRETYLQMTQRLVGGGTTGQTTLDIAKAMAPTTEGEALAVPLRFSVGVQTPNGPSYVQTSGPELTRGTWHQIEAFFVANTPDVADGVARVWLDGALVVERTSVNWALVSGDIYWSEVNLIDLRVQSSLPFPASGQHRDHDHLQVFWSSTRE